MANTSQSNLRSKVRAEMKLDRLGGIWADSEIDDSINEAILEVQNKGDFKWEENEKISSFPTVALQQEYSIDTLISDFIGLDLVEYNGNELASANFITLTKQYQTFPEGTPSEYYLYGGNLGLNPIPTGVQTISIIYRGILSGLTEDTDLSPFLPNFDRAIILYAAYTLLTKPADNKNVARASVKLQRFNDEIAKLYKTYLIKDKGQLFYRSTYVPRSLLRGSRARFRNI